MNDSETIAWKYPYEYFAAAIHFACKIASIQKISIFEALTHYTGLYREYTDNRWDDDQSDSNWRLFLNRIENITTPHKIALEYYKLYKTLPHAKFNAHESPEGVIRFGPLGLDCSLYNRNRNTIRIHYMPQRNLVSELSSSRFLELQQYFYDFLVYAKRNYPEIENFTSSTWVNSVPNFQKLFPESFLNLMVDKGAGSYLGIWGQFVRADGSGNRERFDQFIVALKQAHSFEEIIQALPYKVWEATGPLNDFYTMYTIS